MGGGGDGGYQARQDSEDARKAAARNSLNVLFGQAPTSGSLVNAADYTHASGSAPLGDASGTGDYTSSFDQAGYDAAMAAEANQSADAAKNKAALDALYGTVRTNAYNAGKRGLDEGKTNAARDLKFELFARGLNGGSVDIDQNALLGRKYSEGITNLGGKADAVATQLRTGDENSRLTLLQSIDNGLDQGSAVSSALAQMRNNSDKASSEAIGTDLGDLFGGVGLLYDQGRKARGEQTAADYWRGYGASAGSGMRGSSGTTTRA